MSEDKELTGYEERSPVPIILEQLSPYITEEEFVQMVLPRVHILPIDHIKFLLLKTTTSEVSLIISKIRDPNILNEVAVDTKDDIVGAECAKSEMLTLPSLNILMDKFTTSYHLVLYTINKEADLTFLRRVKKHIELNRNEKLVVPFHLEDTIFLNIGKHTSSDETLLDELLIYVENMIITMRQCEKSVEEMKLKYKKKNPWGMGKSDVKKSKQWEDYNFAVKRVKAYFKVLLEVAGNANINKERLGYLYTTYGKYSVYNIDRDVPGIAMQVLGQFNSDTIGYRVLTNPSIDEEFRAKYIDITMNENRGLTESGASGQEYLARVENADNVIAIRALHESWLREQKDCSVFSFRRVDIKDYARAIGKNKVVPSDVIDDVIQRIYDGGRFYYEHLETIVTNKNIGADGMKCLSEGLHEMLKQDKDYLIACINPVLIPLTESTALTAEASVLLCNIAKKLGEDAYELVMNLAGNKKSCKTLDKYFATHKLRGVKCSYATRSDDLDLLITLQDESEARDVVVAARRRYQELTRKAELFEPIKKDILELKEGEY